MSKPTLFIGLHGPILLPNIQPRDAYGQGRVAEYAKSFLHWAKDRFHVQLLTDEHLGAAHEIVNRLSLPTEQVVPRGFEVSKTEAMHPHESFYWIDSDLIPSEITWLHKNDNVERFLCADPEVGVTPQHKEILENLLRSDKRIKK